MFRGINQTFNLNKKNCIDKTGERNFVLDLLISALKYLKTVTQKNLNVPPDLISVVRSYKKGSNQKKSPIVNRF